MGDATIEGRHHICILIVSHVYSSTVFSSATSTSRTYLNKLKQSLGSEREQRLLIPTLS